MKLDKEVRNYFKKWQKKEQVYLDFDIDEVKFEKKLISSVFDIVRRGASPRPIKDFIVSNDYSGEKFNWLKIGDVTKSNVYLKKTEEYINSNGMRKSVLGKKGDFLITNSMTIGVPIILDIDTCFHDGFLYLGFLDENAVNYSNLYLYYFFLSYRSHLKAVSKSGVVSNLNTDIVKNEHILLPIGDKDFSRGIQDKLVAFIEYYKAQFDEYRKLIAQLKSQVESFDKAFLPAIFSPEKDPFIVEYFDKWAKKNNKELSLSSINFEYVSLFENAKNISMTGSKKLGKHDEIEDINDAEGLPVFDASPSILCHISEAKFPDKVFEVQDEENPDISFASEGNSSAGTNFHIHKGKYFVNNHRIVVRFLTNKFYSKYVYYRLLNMKEEYGFKRGYIPSQSELKSLDVSLWMPKGDDSFEIQKNIVEFIEEWHNWRDEMFRRIDKLSQSIDQAEELLIAKTFKGSEE